MSGILQNFAYGRSFGFQNGWPVANIGDAYGGGYFGGQINISGIKYNLIVSPKASGLSYGVWGVYGVNTGFTSTSNGAVNSAGEAALGSAYVAATFCEGLTIGGYSDWYLPSINELEVLFYYLKPSTDLNNTSYGANPNAVAPEPVNTNYTTTSPPQTSVVSFQQGNSEYFQSTHWSSTEGDAASAYIKNFTYSSDNGLRKSFNAFIRAIRKDLAT